MYVYVIKKVLFKE